MGIEVSISICCVDEEVCYNEHELCDQDNNAHVLNGQIQPC